MPSQSLISQPGKHGFEHTMDDHKFIILGHCPHDEVRLEHYKCRRSSHRPSPEPLTVAFHFFFPRRAAASSFARKPATEPEEDIMGRRKQHCPKKATDGESDQELPSASISSEEQQPHHHNSSSSSSDAHVDIAMAKWIQWQAQLALRLQQQQQSTDNLDHENNKAHQGCTTPLDFSLKSSTSLASLATLMMESSASSSSSAAAATAAGMTALHKMTQLASSQRSQGVSPHRFQSSLPMLSLPYKPLPWQSSWLMMGRPPPPPSSSSMHQPPLPPSPASLRSLGLTEKNLEPIQPDLFRCIWCRQGFPTMTKLGAHLKEANHGGCNQKDTLLAAAASKKAASSPGSTKSESKPGSSTAPRKLVRGQDVWLGKGEEQTRQILKCMWCGQSFRSLADLTTHMSETKHYTKVIPQEQLSTWRAQHQQQHQQRTSSHSPAHSSSTPSPRPTSSSDSCLIKAEKTSHKASKKTSVADLTSIGSGGEKQRKKAIPVRKLLEMERQGVESLNNVNNENDLSDANRMLDVSNAACHPPSSSILGSLERLVESSFKPNSGLEVVTAAAAAAAAAHHVLLAKRASGALGSVFEDAAAEEDNAGPEEKRRRGEERRSTEASSEDSTSAAVIDLAQTPPSRHQRLPVTTISNLVTSSTELKFLKYSELAKELSSGR